MKPHLTLSKEIDSLRAFRQLSIKNYKSLSKLKLTKESLTPQNPKLHKISIKTLNHLDLSSFNTQNFTPSQFQYFLKKSSKIQQFSGPQGVLPVTLLKNSKSIKDLYLKAQFNQLSQRALNLLRICKLRTLKLTHTGAQNESNFEMPIHLSPKKHLPMTIENLSLIWSDVIVTPRVNFTSPFTLEHLKNLKRLELGIPMASEVFKNLIKTIQEPEKLKSLWFNIKQESDEEYEESDEIEEFLRKCSNLEELTIQSDRSYMINFYLATEDLKLKKLAINQFIVKIDDMAKIAELLEHQHDNLESLNLNLMVNSERDSYFVRSWFHTLFRGLKLLKKTRKLKLKLVHFMDDQRQEITGDLAKVIKKLDCLEEIDMSDITGDFNQDDMFEALEKHSKRLRSLNMGLENSNCSKKLIDTLKKFSKLEHLALKTFPMEDSKFLLDLSDIICVKNPCLNSVEIFCSRYASGAENIIKMLKDVIMKPTMKGFCYWETWMNKAEFANLEVLSLADVLKEVHRFKCLQINFETCKPPFYYWDLDKCKWT